MRLQFFPAGTCGIAIGGVPVWRARKPLLRLPPLHLVFAGQSVGTRILVGPLEVWEGVRGGADWNALEPQRPGVPRRVPP